MRAAAIGLCVSILLLGGSWSIATGGKPRPSPHPQQSAQPSSKAVRGEGARGPATLRPKAAARAIWKRAGVFVAFRGLDPVQLGRTLKASNFSWAIVPLHDPAHLMDRLWIEQLRAQGILVGGWAYLGKEPEADAARYSRMLRDYGLSFFVANAEAEYKSDTGGDYERSARFVKAFRALEPEMPAALSSYGYLGDWSKMGSAEDRTKMRVFDFAAWRDGDFRWLPQLYWQSYEEYEPVRAVQWAIAKGWPKDWIHPTIGLYDPDRGGPRRHTALEYVQKLQQVKTAGVSVYSANAIRDEDYRVLSQAIGPRGIARR
jgi:hypothetical protein